jgi:photosystem II stability/assembly factor-like uncharacterized protein
MASDARLKKIVMNVLLYKKGATAAVKVWVRLLLLPFFLFHCGHKPEQNKVLKADWRKLGPGGGGATFIPTFSFETPEKFIIRCDMTGSYVTEDGGESYHQSNFPNGAQGFAYDPQNSGVIYLGASALHKSTDGGHNWEQIFPRKEEIESISYKGDHGSYSIKTVPTSLYNTGIESISNIRVDPLNSDWLYFSMGKSLFYSNDRGASWHRKDLDGTIQLIYSNKFALKDQVLIFTPKKIYSFEKSSASLLEQLLPKVMSPVTSFTGGTSRDGGATILYALHDFDQKNAAEEFRESEVWISNDVGKTWHKAADKILNNNLSGFKPSYSMISASEGNAEHAYIVADRYIEKTSGENRHWYGALKTADGGRSWQWVWKGGGGSGQYGVKDGVGVSNLHDAWVEKAFGGEYIRLMDVGVYPQDGNVAIVTDWYRTMKTIDGGKTWREIYSKTQQDNTFISRGLDVTTAYGVHFDPFDSTHIAISYTDIGYHHSFNGGRSWVRSVEGVPVEWQNTCYWMVFDPNIKNKVWSVWSNLHDFPRGKMTRDPKWKERARGGVCLSLDGGKTWTPSVTGMGDNSSITSIVLDPNSKQGSRTLYAAVYNKGVFKSVDDGKTWQLKNNGIGNNTCAFELTIRPDGTLFLTVSPTPKHKGEVKGRGYFSGAVYRSNDGAETWTQLHISNKPVIFPNGIAYDPKKTNRIYLASWSDISFSDLLGGKVARETGGDSTITTAGGIFMSEDSGDTWTSIFDNNQYVYDVTVDPNHEGRIYCNTFNSAAYRSDDSGKTWKKLSGYNFHWGQRVVMDPWNSDKVYLTTFGSSVLHGPPVIE